MDQWAVSGSIAQTPTAKAARILLCWPWHIHQPALTKGRKCNIRCVDFSKPATGAVSVGACTLTDATNGVVTYEWQPSDTAIAGQFDAKFVVTFPSAQIGTYPNNTTDIVLIGAEIPAA